MGTGEVAGRTEKYAGEINKLGRKKEMAWKRAGCLLGADVQLWAETPLLKSSLSAQFQVASSLLLNLFIY